MLDEKKRSDVTYTIVKYFALCRNALVMAMSMSFVAIMISINGESPVSTPGIIHAGCRAPLHNKKAFPSHLRPK
jgi:hypothetical protein